MTKEEKELIHLSLRSYSNLLRKVHDLPYNIGLTDDELHLMYLNSIKSIELINESILVEEL